MHPTANIIAKFGAAIGIDGLETENGVCTLQFDDVTVTLECAENGDALYLYSRVCGLPESDADKLALYGLLLELDSFFRGTDGGILGIEPLLDAVADTRRLDGIMLWWAQMYNDSHLYFTILTIIIIPTVGCIFGFLADVVMSHIGIDLKHRELAEH